MVPKVGCQPLSRLLNSHFKQKTGREAFAATKRRSPEHDGISSMMWLCSQHRTASLCHSRLKVQVVGHVRLHGCSQSELTALEFPFCWVCSSLPGFFLCFWAILSLYGCKLGSSIAQTGTGLQCVGRLSPTECSFVSQESEFW